MDYHSMNRKELQALCKKHKIPANSANSVLADKLHQLLNAQEMQETKKPKTQQRKCLKTQVETTDEGERGVSKRQAKKVRFSPTNEVLEYELRSGKKQNMPTETRSRRKSVAKKADESVVDNANNNTDVVDDVVQAPVKLTRSKVQSLEKDNVVNNGKKKGRKAVKEVENGIDSVKEPEGNVCRVTRLKLQTLDERGAVLDDNKQRKRSRKDSEVASEPVVEPVVARVRVTRSKAQNVDTEIQEKRGRTRLAKDVKNDEAPKETIDIPVRVMRSSRHEIKEEVERTVASPRVEKKRTRRESKATDMSDNLSNVVSDEKKERPKRKSLRTKGTEVADEVEDDKVENAMKPSRRNTRSKTENKVDKPLEDASKKTVSRRKSVVQPEKSEKILSFEEPMNRPNTRRKSMVQEAPGKEVDKPLVGKGKSVKESNILMSPTVATRKNVGRKQSKGKTNNSSMIKEGLEDAENEMEAVANATVSPKSRKRRGDPIVDNQIIDTENISSVDASSKRSTRSNQGKAVTYSPQSSVAKKQTGSILKTRVANRDGSSRKSAKLSRTKINESVDHAEKSDTVATPVTKSVTFDLGEKVTETERTPDVGGSHRRSSRSAVVSDRKQPSQSVVKKQPGGDSQLSLHKVTKFTHDPAVNTAPVRVTRSGVKHGGKSAISFSEKLSRTKPSESVDHTEKYNTEGTPVLTSVNFDLEEKVQSETSLEMADQFVEDDGDISATGSMKLPTEVVGEDTVSVSETANVTQHLGSSFSGLCARVKDVGEDMGVVDANTDVTVDEQVVYEGETVVMNESFGVSVGLTVEENNTVVSDLPDASSSPIHLVSFEQSDDKIESGGVGTPVGSLTEDIGEAEVEKESEQNVSTCKDSLLNSADKHDASINSEYNNEDERVSIEMQVLNEPVSDGNQVFGMDKHDGAEDVLDTGKELAKEPEFEGDTQIFGMDEHADADLAKEPEFEGGTQMLGMDENDGSEDVVDAGKELAKEPEFEGDTQIFGTDEHDGADDVVDAGKEHAKEPEFEGDTQIFGMDENDGAEDVVDAGKELTKEPEFEGDTQTFGMDEHDDAEDVVDTGNELDKEPEFEGDTQVFGMDEHDDADDIVDAGKEHAKEPEFEGGTQIYGEDEHDDAEDVVDDGKELAKEPEVEGGTQIFGEDEHDDAEDVVDAEKEVAKEFEFEGGTQIFGMDEHDDAEDVVDTEKELAKDPEFEGAPSGNDVHESPMLHKFDGVDGSETDTNQCGTDSMPLSGDNMPSDGENLALNEDDIENEAFNISTEHESDPKPLTNDDSDTSLFGKDEDLNITRLFEPTLESTSSDDLIETPHLKPLTGNKDDVQDEVNILSTEVETGLGTSNANNNSVEVPVVGHYVNVDPIMDYRSDEQGKESENKRSTSNETSFVDEQYVEGADSASALNENIEPEPMSNVLTRSSDIETEPMSNVLTRSSDIEPEPMSNVTVGKVSSDTDGARTPVGHFASIMSVEAPLTPAVTTVDVCEESIPDVNKDADAHILGDIYGLKNAQVTDTESGSLSGLKVIGISDKMEHMVSTDKKEQTISAVDHDLDGGKLVEESSNHGVDQLEHVIPTTDSEVSGQLMGDFGGQGHLFTNESLSITYEKEESHVGDTLSDSPTLVKDGDRNEQDLSLETFFKTPATTRISHIKVTQMETGSSEAFSAHVSETLSESPTFVKDGDQNMQDNQFSGLQTSVTPSSSMEGNYNLATYREFDQDIEFDHDADIVKENTNAKELYTFPDSSLRALFTQPATTSSSHLNEGKHDAISFDISDGSHDEDMGKKGTPTHDFNIHAESESARHFNDLSLDTLFKTPATTRISHLKDSQMETGSSEAFSGKTQVIETPATTLISHLKDGQMENESSEAFTSKTQVIETPGQYNATNRVQNYENFYNRYFDDEQVDGSSDRPGEFKGDEYDFSSEAAQTGHFDTSDLKDNSILGDMPEKKQD
ncbi:uncharacterized protein [Rutidosis leptorrhynchoides]|uniref:uncharacterized protein isoform X2 n=1 Tax=Rutidosis leptorrhynchoides TaxID=125765 RepID=UPI003A99AABB